MHKDKREMLIKNSKNSWIPLTLILINFIFKGLYISSDSISIDEPFSIYHAQMSIIAIINQLSTGNNPPLYEILLHFWIKIFGISPLSVRFPSLIFSCITLFYIYKLCIKNFNLRVAIYASVFFIFSNYHTLFAHEARVYALLGMLTVISMYYFLKIIDHKSDKTKKQNTYDFLFLLLSNILLMYAHYFGFFVLIVQCLFVLIHKEFLSKYWKPIIYAIIILLIAYIPNMVILFKRFIEASRHGTWVDIPNGVVSIYNMLWKFSNKPVVTVSVIAVLLTATIKYFFLRKNKNITTYNTPFIAFWFLFIFFFMFGISYLLPMFVDRYLMPAAIAFCILLAISVDYLINRKYFTYILPCLLCILFISTAKPNISNKRNAKETIEKIKQIKTDNVIVFFCPSWFDINFIYYYNIDCFKNYDETDIKKNMYLYFYENNIFPINNQNQIDFSLVKNFEKVIFIDVGADFSMPDNGILQKLQNTYTLENIYFSDKTYRIYVFDTTIVRYNFL